MARKRIIRPSIDERIVAKYIELYNYTVGEAWTMIRRKRMFNELPE